MSGFSCPELKEKRAETTSIQKVTENVVSQPKPEVVAKHVPEPKKAEKEVKRTAEKKKEQRSLNFKKQSPKKPKIHDDEDEEEIVPKRKTKYCFQ